jgi:excisionase family DNA binding protein
VDKVLLKPEEVAQMLALGRSTVYELIATGALPSIRVGKVIRVRREDLQRWVESTRSAAGSRKEGKDD